MNVVIYTNVLVSGVFWNGTPRKILSNQRYFDNYTVNQFFSALPEYDMTDKYIHKKQGFRPAFCVVNLSDNTENSYSQNHRSCYKSCRSSG